jgi:LPXTG-motif cell wall-anchored protein
MEFILMDVDASSEILSSRGIIILVVAALTAIALITTVFLWRKKKNKK